MPLEISSKIWPQFTFLYSLKFGILWDFIFFLLFFSVDILCSQDLSYHVELFISSYMSPALKLSPEIHLSICIWLFALPIGVSQEIQNWNVLKRIHFLSVGSILLFPFLVNDITIDLKSMQEGLASSLISTFPHIYQRTQLQCLMIRSLTVIPTKTESVSKLLSLVLTIENIQNMKTNPYSAILAASGFAYYEFVTIFRSPMSYKTPVLFQT